MKVQSPMKTARTITKRYWWATERRDQGQIVKEMYPQLAGCAEGEEGQAEGLRLRYDASDGDWVLSDTKIIMRGNRFRGQQLPTVEAAMAMRRSTP